MADKVLMKGNEAVAEAAILAGCRHFFGYPITPQTEIAAYMAKRMPKIGGTYLQAESEIAAINMVIGASSMGARVMTSSSSPGISLKSEGLSYLAGCDLPAVLMNVQRGGPGLGGIQPSQADYFQATRSSGHGDFHMIVLAPNSIQEMVDLTLEAFDLAGRYRMTVMLLSDGILGQMMEPVALPASFSPAPDANWELPRENGRRRIVNSLYLMPEDLEKLNFERYARYDIVKQKECRSDGFMLEDAEIVVAAYGAAARVARNAVLEARSQGIRAGLIRPVSLWPFPQKAFADTLRTAKAYVVVEMSMGQMIDDVRLAIECRRPVSLCNRTGGIVPAPEEVLAAICQSSKGV